MHLYQNDLPADVSFEGSVAVDTEAMGLVTRRDRLCLVQLCSSTGDVHMVQMQRDRQDKSENLKKILIDPSILKIFHFARFDVSILNYTFGIKVAPIYCTKIASKLVRTYTDKHGLKNLCKDILGIDISKQEQTSDWGRQELSKEQLKYASGDVLHLHNLKEKLDEMLEREGKTGLASDCFKMVDLISSLELSGIVPE
ncbi:MAG: ribonuclease H-like domain-containing protein, partial [Holosporaceae bacterium]|nr:ribonuclease H-like domain-containing protein [Holosporaceae bacterium]